jgi:hypothetical protein
VLFIFEAVSGLEAAQAADMFQIRPLYVRDILCSAKPVCRDDLVQ